MTDNTDNPYALYCQIMDLIDGLTEIEEGRASLDIRLIRNDLMRCAAAAANFGYRLERRSRSAETVSGNVVIFPGPGGAS